MIIERTVCTPNLTMNMEFELTPKELRIAYDEQNHVYDMEDIENELDLCREDYVETYSIDIQPVTESEFEEMAHELRRILDKDADASWSYARQAAVNKVLRMRG